ncbi:Com family DNA-binding transcriptional regulator [Undibacterium sp. Di26W]|uniref:Com family DNA-binding transcriptional regulator n=1 Tax=Undibacterium sp. Di26W TaxID=3413035 RepID=UPI003BF295D6
MQEIRCGSCSKKLGFGDYKKLSIKCPRCGVINQFSTASASDERLRASLTNFEDKYVCNKETNNR